MCSDWKGQSNEIFCARFFPQTAPPGPIRDVLGLFRFFLLLVWVISILKWLPGVLCTGELRLPGVLCTRESKLPGVLCTGESRLLSTLWGKTPWCSKCRGIETPRCPMYQGIETPRCPMYRGVETHRCPMYRGVFFCFFEPSSPCNSL